MNNTLLTLTNSPKKANNRLTPSKAHVKLAQNVKRIKYL